MTTAEAEGAIRIRPVFDPEDLDAVRRLFREYAEQLDFPVHMQGFEEELADLPGPYAPPEGRLYLADWHGDVAGCVALRRLTAGTCEVKRLYVKPHVRGRGVGRALMGQLVADARLIGYRRMVLDTLHALAGAVALYRSMGFRDIEPYHDDGDVQVMAMELPLDPIPQ